MIIQGKSPILRTIGSAAGRPDGPRCQGGLRSPATRGERGACMSRPGHPQKHRAGRLGLVAGVAATTLLGALVALPPPAARAFDVAQSKVVTDNPADSTPDVVSSGSVRYLAQAGNTM